ncbi:HPr family phosphocarrier protein [Marinibactrum halimedae]|uniref:Phosphocarrier protein HPr n=1 Tax=Marinibactrum halimedae TaxID=1444977 RepID=A0AA37T4F2_9GAMM|nr:HPr family phosphocarrier protein [Marinibactrum halimedae]MCD9457520.1 HPr family phosphocarrier protein [Marinibactrum halimedae]GLS25426.1 phosphocarrier protein HPr [Marinibactrum halimedae]
MLERTVEITNIRGLHARAATLLAKTAMRFSSQINLCYEDRSVDCKSVMAIMLLAAGKGSEVTLQVSGQDQDNAIETISDLILDKFGEGE